MSGNQMGNISLVRCADGTEYPSSEYNLRGSVKTVRSRDINRPACIGQFPVFVDKRTSRLFTYSKKITEIVNDRGIYVPAIRSAAK